jgi:hypothetical protein
VTLRVTSLAALCEVVFATMMAAFALGLPLRRSEGDSFVLLILGLQCGVALLAAAGLYRRQRWGWLLALCVIALAFGPVLLTIYWAWRAGMAVGVMMPPTSVRLVAVAWLAQLAVAACFLQARGWRPSTPAAP